MEPTRSYIDVQETVREIREKVRAKLLESRAPTNPTTSGGLSTSNPLAPDLNRLRDSAHCVTRVKRLVGQAPPTPPGLRARIGALLVRIVQRMLFWYTPQILQFHDAVAEAVGEQVSTLASMSVALEGLKSRIESMQAGVDALQAAHSTEEETRALASRLDKESERSGGLEAGLQALEERLTQTKLDLLNQDRRVSVLLHEAVRRLPEPFSVEQVRSLANECSSDFDSFYVAFEDAFRGSRIDIKSRLQVYVPILKDASIGGPDMPVLDLGCGRGEWLELLGDNGMDCRGVDANSAMVTRCHAHGLPALHVDAITYLQSVPPASLGAVTAFHLLEHLPTRQLVEVLDQTVRVFKPGGIAIFETPNPANIQVGANTFHQDPTHIHPLPSAALKFMAEARGLFRVEVLDLHPYPVNNAIPGDDRGFAQRFNRLFYGPQDYAIIGRKS
jgi:2-polyprenyl-3-methyl-5-hydroxy-6-metoxy-1,4-benzoquinol methylase